MRVILGFALACILTDAIALTVIADTGNTINSNDYLLSSNTAKNETYNKAQPPKHFQSIGIPAHSQLRCGEVSAYRLDENQGIPQSPFFVVGDDEQSEAWLINNAEFLKEQHALGFVTNIESEARLNALSELVGMSLLPVNVDVFAKALGVNHYPFFTDGKELWQ